MGSAQAIDPSDEDAQGRDNHSAQQQGLRADNMAEAARYWMQVNEPRASNRLIMVDQIESPVLTFLRRGRKFMELSSTLGINQATKSSRLVDVRS